MRTISTMHLRSAIESMITRECFDCSSNWGSVLSVDCGAIREVASSFSRVGEPPRIRREGEVSFWITASDWQIVQADQVILSSDSEDMRITDRLVGESLLDIEFDSGSGAMTAKFTSGYCLKVDGSSTDRSYAIRIFGTWFRLKKMETLFVLREHPKSQC